MRYAVILAGGSGTRLWPLSRSSLPKQLIPAVEGRSLLEEAWRRLDGLVPVERRHVCAAEKFRSAVTARVPGLAGERFIGEPAGRNTLAAITLSCSLISRQDPEAVVAIVAADQVIEPAVSLHAAMDAAFGLVEKDQGLLVTFGVRPTYAATGFGWLELAARLPDGAGAHRVGRFREKPGHAEAELFLEQGPERFLWNSGMFLWRASRFLELVGRYQPDVLAAIEQGVKDPGRLAEAYAGVKEISVDYGLMEPASRDTGVTIAAVPLDVDWMDVGSWHAYARLLKQDEAGNARSGLVLLTETRGSVALSTDPDHLVACLGCEDLIVVHTPDATLVCPRSRADDVRKLQALVIREAGERFG